MNACRELSPLPKETPVNQRFASLDQDTLNNQGFTSLEQDPEDIISKRSFLRVISRISLLALQRMATQTRSLAKNLF